MSKWAWERGTAECSSGMTGWRQNILSCWTGHYWYKVWLRPVKNTRTQELSLVQEVTFLSGECLIHKLSWWQFAQLILYDNSNPPFLPKPPKPWQGLELLSRTCSPVVDSLMSCGMDTSETGNRKALLRQLDMNSAKKKKIIILET